MTDKYEPRLTREQKNEKLLDCIHYIQSVFGNDWGVLLIVRDERSFLAHVETQGCGEEPCPHEIDMAITNRNEEIAEHLAVCWLEKHSSPQHFSEKGN